MDRIERITYYENILNEATEIIRRCETAEEEYQDARDEYQDARDEYQDACDEYQDARREFLAAQDEFLAAQNAYLAVRREYRSARDLYLAAQERIAQLERYYTSPEWMDDFEASERGELPKGLHCGVLSEDGIDDLLDDNRELMQEEELSEEDDVSPVTLQDSPDDRELI